MLEQSLYEPETVAKPLKEGDPFYNYEIKGWQLSPRIYKILGISALANILVLVVAVQGSLLTTKGCDSPLVGTMCDALDTIYVGSMIFGTDREYVDVAYDKTDLGDVDITYVDVTGLENQKLYYPSDYWQIANPEKYTIDPTTGELIAAMPPSLTSDIPGIPNGIPFSPQPGGDSLFNTTPVFPKANPNPVQGTLPQPGGSGTAANPIGRNKKGRGGKATPVTEPEGTVPGILDPNTTAEVKPSPSPTVEPTAPVTAVTINREPLKVYGRDMAQRIEKNEVDIRGNFKVEAVGTLTADGRLDTSIDSKTKQQKSRIIKAEGDPNLVKAASEAIAVVGDSGWLGYLSQQDIQKIKFIFGQTDDQLIVTIFADPPKGKNAESIASGLNVLIAGALYLNLGDDEKKLLQSATVATKDRQLVLYFALPKAEANEMIMRNIQKAKEEVPAAKSTSAAEEPSPTK